MKMTQEEKAKAYDEALEKAKELLDSPRTCFDIEQLKDIFSELAESDDERIRKGMIDEIKAILRGEDLGFPPQDVLESRLAYLEKQKEQKPIPANSVGLKEQKLAWSVKDEKNLKSVVSTLWFALNTPHFPLNYERIIELEGWLKSLLPQPKAKLTLLDENIIEAAVAFVEQNDHFNCWGGIDKRTVIKALRSLKPHWKPSE